MAETSNAASPSAAADTDQLAALGYTAHFDRTMSLWENFALGFTYLSPVVGVYSVFATSLAAGGPPMVWSYLLAGLGQFMVCLIFSEIVAQFPIAGGIYPWCRRLVGKRWAWMAGWVYGWALFTTIAAVALGAGPFLADFLGFPPTPGIVAGVAIVLVAIATGLNLAGTTLLARVAMFGFVCELLGAIVVGLYLLVFHRHNPPAILLDSFNIRSAGGSYLPGFLAGATAGLFCCYGFEACADLAEETPDPGRRIPMAMRMTIYIGVTASIFVCVALLLAVPDIGAVIAGKETNPVGLVLKSTFGPVGAKAVIAVVMVSFLSCILSLQAAVSRLLYAYGRDGMIIGSQALTRMSQAHVPWVALLVAGAVPGCIILASPFLADAIATVISFATAGIYLAFQMVVVAAIYARLRGWRPGGAFSLGGWGLPVNLVALVYGMGALLDMVWPRAPDQAWFVNFGMIVTVVGIVVLGLIYMAGRRPHDRGVAPAADAWLLTR